MLLLFHCFFGITLRWFVGGFVSIRWYYKNIIRFEHVSGWSFEFRFVCSACINFILFLVFCFVFGTLVLADFKDFRTKGAKKKTQNHNAKYRRLEFCDDRWAINHCHHKYQNGNNRKHIYTHMCGGFTSPKSNENK